MNNRFNINEEEKNRIKGLHNIKEEDFVSRRGYDSDYTEDSRMDTPGGNPDYFYGDGSLDKLRNKDKEISREEIIKILNQIHTLQHENAPAIAQRRLEELFDKLDIKINNKEI